MAGAYHNRQWLEEGGMAAVRAVVEEQTASFTITDGHHSLTLDFVLTSPEECAAAARKAARLQELVDEFSAHIRLRDRPVPVAPTKEHGRPLKQVRSD
jgi:hypothetical protein